MFCMEEFFYILVFIKREYFDTVTEFSSIEGGFEITRLTDFADMCER